jgi:hypothetical protein
MRDRSALRPRASYVAFVAVVAAGACGGGTTTDLFSTSADGGVPTGLEAGGSPQRQGSSRAGGASSSNGTSGGAGLSTGQPTAATTGETESTVTTTSDGDSTETATSSSKDSGHDHKDAGATVPIPCGAETCSDDDPICCVSGTPPDNTYSCTTSSTACKNAGGHSVACLTNADCAGQAGQECCVNFGDMDLECAAGCTGESAPVCNTSEAGQCAADETCTAIEGNVGYCRKNGNGGSGSGGGGGGGGGH